MFPAAQGACTLGGGGALTFSLPQVPVILGRDLPGIPSFLGTTGWTSGPGFRAPPATQRTFALQCASRDDWRCARSMHEFSAKDIDEHMVNLDKYRGFVCIVTNVASQ